MKRRKLLVVLEGGATYPSGFVRGLIYRDSMVRRGWIVEFRSRRLPALAALIHRPPRWLAPLTTRGPGRLAVYGLMEIVSRLYEPFLAYHAKRADVVYTVKVRSLRLIRKLRKGRARLVMDFSDAEWLNPLYAADFEELIRYADATTTDNEYTARYVRRFHDDVTVLPDAPQVERFDEKRGRIAKSTDGRVVLGWLGSPGTLYNLYLIWPVLERLFAKYPQLHLRVIGAGTDSRLLPPFERVRYSALPFYDQSRMVDEVLALDVGLFPMIDVENSVTRGILKAAVYMSGEVAVVASPVGQAADFIRDGENGFLAASDAEWERKLTMLIEDPSLRQRLAASGLATVRSNFTIDASFAILDGVLQRQVT